MSSVWNVGRVVRVIDGDSVILAVTRTLDFDGDRYIDEVWPQVRVRLVTLDTPERGEVGWADAKSHVEVWLSQYGLRSLEIETYGRDSLGRWLGDIYVIGDRSNTLSQWMLREGGWLPWVPR